MQRACPRRLGRSHWPDATEGHGAAAGDWLLSAQAWLGMAAPVRRSVVFVTGNAKKLEEVGGGRLATSGLGARGPERRPESGIGGGAEGRASPLPPAGHSDPRGLLSVHVGGEEN